MPMLFTFASNSGKLSPSGRLIKCQGPVCRYSGSPRTSSAQVLISDSVASPNNSCTAERAAGLRWLPAIFPMVRWPVTPQETRAAVASKVLTVIKNLRIATIWCRKIVLPCTATGLFFAHRFQFVQTMHKILIHGLLHKTEDLHDVHRIGHRAFDPPDGPGRAAFFFQPDISFRQRLEWPDELDPHGHFGGCVDADDRLPAGAYFLNLAVAGIGRSRRAVDPRDRLADRGVLFEPGAPGSHRAEGIDMAPDVGAGRLYQNVLFIVPSPSN